ncbi:benzene 1,2-dioxygenase [Sphingopyxis lindanitolerans]|jgi:benzoate/toluate 1,2-dioxygenase beta subunit|uniref:Benzene 1,2-dioxygenase n=1 Tax=Sphingopyxis lindanitolerans TaxID=2054227 RepID=A0A2S8B7K4_9SPHN|nr:MULTISPECIES: aromatic-ring-hydroxylating dioxygenase subunit beta [Sphingopyxis]MDR6833997.1 benzoate/toluate 1,2-dioxygenase beta subunit [Sphingopyxis sp. BE122]MDR7226266.1 benzoate/toluate 1,2-dioxygenase beta subunit [Sphingopyxis sp. BE259]PQM28391.1 benzene 1,2-dioxygenase [Sphingopyxis lindanitolerans]
MSSEVAQWTAIQRFLGREAAALDAKDWDSWIDLYHPDAEYWVPAWDDSGRLTEDPRREISLIYYPTRAGLEDRVYRIRTGRSSASSPAPRTSHIFSLLAVDHEDDIIRARTNWSVTSVLEDRPTVYSGSAIYDLEPMGDAFVIKRKYTVVINDLAQTMLDVYSI